MSVDRRQFVRYVFYKVMPEWRRLDGKEKTAGKQQLTALVDQMSSHMMIRPYSLLGTRADADMFFWEVCDQLEDLQKLSTEVASTQIGHYLETPYSYLAMTRKSSYVEKHSHKGQESTRIRIKPVGSKYLFVYPFVKTRDWYLLSLERRQELMDAHISTGHRYPNVKINTSYSFGLDDQDFVVSFESDEPGDFLDLVMELRETEASKYTVRDTPIFSGISMSIMEVLDSLGN